MTVAAIARQSRPLMRPRARRQAIAWPRPRLAYLIGWLLYCLLLVTVFLLNRAPLWPAIWASLRFAVPSAMLGLLVMRLCDRLSSPAHYPAKFTLYHFAGALAFSLGSLVAANALTSALLYVTTGRQTFVWQQTPVVRFHLAMGIVAYCALAAAIYADRFSRVARSQARRRARAEILRQRSELQALRAQLNPHFLMNTLHSIVALMRHEPREAERAIDHLAGLLVYTHRKTGANSDFILFEEEWQFVERFLALERMRYGPRLRVVTEMPSDVFACIVPSFVLQPLVENAIAHGVASQAAGGQICISAVIDARSVQLIVSDDGVGAMPGRLHDSRGTGLRTLQRRLDALYGSEGRLTIKTAPNAGYSACVTIPRRTRSRHD